MQVLSELGLNEVRKGRPRVCEEDAPGPTGARNVVSYSITRKGNKSKGVSRMVVCVRACACVGQDQLGIHRVPDTGDSSSVVHACLKAYLLALLCSPQRRSRLPVITGFSPGTDHKPSAEAFPD